ncbi:MULTISPECIES: phosphogluconate dehydrogenase (NAD(+)-dependent, decarboxylating) [unclassified Paenibacillus]|uniref:phosphogluconate dehydrogenase (NAD(+)-dependent, decarboxylating) n=1 Tax=unclassified Paenibacillus TaxID=185978 RepID=UPI000956BBD1|nr:MULTISPECIES: decarboxylating 6-phosphogluconate dehydrogenase [unclassified Paenibacillus]ASS65502.1 decarboxylating 6-phosphogluconate dehydrogenase [Paenibacillus sp. RUD330]SIQ34035.1 6-phosphogluconate dehydrogenase [Paenibacillus sp. RU4X]SIQ55739.1 6-phosphogluconate dehydrogenase [Paenibacillus sp. RU4T]
MHIGLIGLGKMGMNMGRNLMDHGYRITAFDVNPKAVEELRNEGAQGAFTLKELADSLPMPRIALILVPHQVVDGVLEELGSLFAKGDIIIEAGNSHYKETIRRYERMKEAGISYVDAGTSGGMEGARSGACYMVGGDADAWETVEPIFRDTSVPDGYLYAGKSGSGHFLKMVHNGIEYGMMAAIGEGFEVLEKSGFDFDYEKVARVWNNGSVIRSWLMELSERAFAKDADLEELRGVMNSSGEGKWTVETALDLQAAIPVIAMSLMMRYRSLESDTFTGKVVAALRNEFGGHAVVRSE